jgi:hypothetical protein
VAVAQEQKLKATDVMFREEASEKTWKEKAASGGYSIYYFATHGLPYAEIFQTRINIGKVLEKTRKKYEETKDEKLLEKIKGFEAFANFYDKTFMSKSPLNGFLYMTYAGEEGQDGVLTLKEIMEMPESSFKSANLAILSACNTAVTYSPMVSPKTRKNLETAEIDKELLAAGFTPGVDQVSLTDTFMRRKFKSVLGTLWFADDQATSFIIARFFENLAKNPPAEALRQAQLQYLEKPPMDDKFTKVPKHPYYWAVSAVFGE